MSTNTPTGQSDSSLKGCLPFVIAAILISGAAIALVMVFNVFGPADH